MPPLGKDQVEKLLAQEKARTSSASMPQFFIDEKLKAIAKAYVNGHTTVTLEGKPYKIEERAQWPNDVLVTPADGRFVPTGWFPKQKLRSLLKAGVE